MAKATLRVACLSAPALVRPTHVILAISPFRNKKIVCEFSPRDFDRYLAFAPDFDDLRAGFVFEGREKLDALRNSLIPLATAQKPLLLPVAAFYATALLIARRGHALIEQPAE